MILKSLRLKNFRKFQDILLEFPDGVTGVIGFNGVGKSTIFEALAWALYGSVAARTSADQIKRENTIYIDPCRVELEFILGEDKYRVVREMSGKNLTASASVTVNNKMAADGAEIVSRYIQRKLGMDFKSFYTSIFAKQKELNALSSINPSERRPLILRMLGINVLDEIIAEIRSDIKSKKGLVEKLTLDLVDENGESWIEIYRDEIESLEGKKNDISNLVEQIKNNVLTGEKEFNLLKRECDDNKNIYEEICKVKEQLDEQKILIDKKKRYRNEIKDLEYNIKERKQAVEKQKLKLKDLKDIDEELKSLEIRQNENNISLEKVVKKIERNKIYINRIQKDVKEFKRKHDDIEKMGPSAKCPTCERVLDEQYNRLLETYTREIHEKNDEVKALQREGKQTLEEHQRLSRQREALQRKRNYLQSQWIERERINTTIQNLSKEINREEKSLENKKNELAKIDVEYFEEEKYIQIKNKVNESYKKYQSSLEVLNEKRNILENIKLNQERKEGEKKLIIQQIKNLQQKIEGQKKLIKKKEKEKKDLQNINMLNEIMASFRTHLISQIRPTLSIYASELFDQLTDGKYSEIELDENYNLMVYDNGVSYDIERFSGGEEDLANLCIRLAISEVIAERAGNILNLIILDEIFGSQDTIRRQNIIRALNSFSSKFRQIFLITHIEEIKNSMENVITVLEHENGISTVKIE